MSARVLANTSTSAAPGKPIVVRSILDEEGRLYITGRKKDLIIYQGKNFYGHDLAASVAELPVAKVGHTYAFSIDVDGVERERTGPEIDRVADEPGVAAPEIVGAAAGLAGGEEVLGAP